MLNDVIVFLYKDCHDYVEIDEGEEYYNKLRNKIKESIWRKIRDKN